MRFWRQRYSLDSSNTVWQRSMATSSSPPQYQPVPRVESLPATPNEQYISVKREMLAIQILLKTVSQPSSTSDCHHEAPAAKTSLGKKTTWEALTQAKHCSFPRATLAVGLLQAVSPEPGQGEKQARCRAMAAAGKLACVG